MVSRPPKFDDHARKALPIAQQEANRLNHNFLGTEHILLALTRMPECVATQVLTNLGVDLNEVRSLTRFYAMPYVIKPQNQVGITPSVKRVVELASEEACCMNDDYIGTEHLLIGLIGEGTGVAWGVSDTLRVTLRKVRFEVARILGKPTTSEAMHTFGVSFDELDWLWRKLNEFEEGSAPVKDAFESIFPGSHERGRAKYVPRIREELAILSQLKLS